MIQPTLVPLGNTQIAKDGSGKMTVTIAVPNNTQLRDLEVITQWLVFDQSGVNGLLLENAMRL